VDFDQIAQWIQAEQLSIDDPEFYQKVFGYSAKKRAAAYSLIADNYKRTCAEEYEQLSMRLDATKIQESCAVRNVLRTRRLANLLIDDKGELRLSVLPRLEAHLKTHLYSLGPGQQYDSIRQVHLLKVIRLLQENKELVRLLKNIYKPVAHKYADQIIRDTLALPPKTAITDAHARRAVLAAWICYLRQNVGSCFATAPAIIVHDEQPELFLKDLSELLNTGRLKRTFGGVEYVVPLSKSWGAGDLRKPIFLPLGEDFEKSLIWLSPGLEAAFEAAELLDPELPQAEKQAAVKQLILSMLHALEWNQPFIMLSAEEILRKVLLHQLGLTEEQIKEQEVRPVGMVHGGLLMHTPMKQAGGKKELAAQFLGQFEAACTAFKQLADNALLKAWEFSVASFAETKAQFTRWNLYASLGLGANDQGGIGPCLYENVKSKLDLVNHKVQELQYEYEQVFHQLKTMEARMRSVSSEREAQWLKMEYQTKRNEFYTLEEMRDQLHQKARFFANLYDALIDSYDSLFPLYFQEVYDADMHDVTAGPYDDSPAGFRLLYKFGRSNTSQWTLIKTPEQFIDALADFFTATESQVRGSPGLEGLESELSELITAIVSHIRTREFLETAFYRMAAAHKTRLVKDPLDHLDLIEKKPWAYTSGGTMSGLISSYYRLEQPPAEAARWVESPAELLVFLIDTLKQIPPKMMEEYLVNPQKSMLIHSPTHAFLLKPGSEAFRQAWQTDQYTYTWVRDVLIQRQENFVRSITLDVRQMHFLLEHLVQKISIQYQHYFRRVFGNIFYTDMQPFEFRETLCEGMRKDRGLKQAGSAILSVDEIDAALYMLLPLTPRQQLRSALEQLYAAIPQIEGERRQNLVRLLDLCLPSFSQEPLISAPKLQEICKSLLCLELEETSAEWDYHALVSQAAESLGLAMPAPLIFADTNWMKDYFGFLFNPGSAKFELWRIDQTGRVGSPMSYWEEWLDGSRQDLKWGVYTKPYEYKGP
jgi:hypothetical protein